MPDQALPDIPVPSGCPHCQTQNATVNRFCSLCGPPLDSEAGTAVLQDDIQRRRVDSIFDRMLKDPEFKEQSFRKLKAAVASPARLRCFAV